MDPINPWRTAVNKCGKIYSLYLYHYLQYALFFKFFQTTIFTCAPVRLHHVYTVNVGPAHIGTCGYETPILPSPLPLVGLLSFQNHTICDMCMVLSTSIMDEIPKIFVRRKISPRVIKRGMRGGALHKYMYLWPDLGNSSREIPVFNFQGIK